jgi:hypothetical protein
MGTGSVVLYAKWVEWSFPGYLNIMDTGQTGDYTATFGEDSDYVDLPNARSYTGPTQHLTYTDDYTTKDNVTGLIWKTCSEGQTGETCTGTASTYTWANAFAPCEALNAANSGAGYAGRTDWHLPTIEELNTLPDYGRFNPAINTVYFPGTASSSYWSSSTGVGTTDYAWSVFFYYGLTNSFYKTNSYYVRCVSGQ